MKCQTCGGSIVHDLGSYASPTEMKCLSCGRRVMETEKKTCTKCGGEFPETEDYFRKSSANKDGFEGQCKSCRKKYFDDYRKKKKNELSLPPDHPPQKLKKQRKHTILPAHRKTQCRVTQSPLSTASPEAILAALRKGVAIEIIALIEGKFGTV